MVLYGGMSGHCSGSVAKPVGILLATCQVPVSRGDGDLLGTCRGSRKSGDFVEKCGWPGSGLRAVGQDEFHEHRVGQRRVVVALAGHETDRPIQPRGRRHGRQRIEPNSGIANVPRLVEEPFDQPPANPPAPSVLPHIEPLQLGCIACQWPERHAAGGPVVGQRQ